MEGYLNPAAFDEARSVLEALKGSPLAILSNGSPRMLDSAVRSNGLESYFAEIISVDSEDVQTVSSRLRPWARNPESSAAEILFVSSNLWDAAGAKAFG